MFGARAKAVHEAALHHDHDDPECARGNAFHAEGVVDRVDVALKIAPVPTLVQAHVIHVRGPARVDEHRFLTKAA